MNIEVAAPQKSCPTADTIAKTTLSSLPQKPYEYGVTFECVALTGVPDTVESNHLRNSFSAGQVADPCRVSIYNGNEAVVGLGHTHPLFNTSEEFTMGIGCGGDKSPKTNQELVAAINILLTEKYPLQQHLPDVQIELRDVLESIKQTGEQSEVFYLTYAQLLSGTQKISALQKAVALTKGKPGQALAWLGEQLLENDKYDEAITVFEKLIEHGLPPYSDIAQTYLQVARQRAGKTQ